MSDVAFYKPDLTEFHLGFEFEITFDKKQWHKKVFDHTDCVPSIWSTNRAKKVDHEDIISLGWHDCTVNKKFGRFYRMKVGPTVYQLAYYNDERIQITEVRLNETLFSGWPKSKPELAVIMRQVKIIL